MTTTDVARELKLTPAKVKKRLKQGTLPPPTYVNEHRIRFFNRTWLKAALLVVGCERGRITPFELAHNLKLLGVTLECSRNLAQAAGTS